MPSSRTETDSFGPIEVPSDALWGAQTERSRRFFAIGERRMPLEIVHALAQVKRAAAEVNRDLGLLEPGLAVCVATAATRVAAGEFDTAFPLSVWQTGSGTQSHMNVNEVIANLPSALLGGGVGTSRCVHPNDDVNLGQSSNDVFPTAMHVAVVLRTRPLLASLAGLRAAIRAKAEAFADIPKVGRTHLQDATPVTFGQEFGAYDAQLAIAEAAIRRALPDVHALAIGGTAVGTGLNTHREFGTRVAAVLAKRLNAPLRRRGQPVCGDGRPRTAAGFARRAANSGRRTQQSGQRHPTDGQRPARRPGRTAASSERARQLDHAGQGQPDAGRGNGDGLRPGDGARRGDRHRGESGAVRTECLQAADCL
jgi:fumarate hydratase class II